MLLLTMILLLAAVPDPCLGQEVEDEDEDEDDNIEPVSPDMKTVIVDKHNEIRRDVEPSAANMLKMEWNDIIAQNALRWAEECIVSNSPEDSRMLGDRSCGETVYHTNQFTEWPDIIDFWKRGKMYFIYDVGNTDPRKNIYPYTQIIWYNSYMIGCAVAYCPDMEYNYAYVCQYCSEGNLQNQIATPYKKGEWCESCPGNCEDKLCTNPCQYTDTFLNCPELKKMYTCKRKSVIKGCQATCRCDDKII